MNDEELPINAELASAYLDGELDPAERASAAADPDVMVMVDSFGRVRAALNDVEPVVDSTRTAAMAAALAEFDARQAAPNVVPTSAKVTSLHTRRMGAYRILTGVAAAAVVGVIAVAALNSNGGDNNLSTAIEATANPAEDAGAAQPELKVADAAAGAAPADSVAAATAGDQAIEAASPAPEIDSADALAQYVTDVSRATAPASAGQADTTAAPSDVALFAEPTCLDANHTVLGSIVYQGTPAYAVRDTSSGAVQAIDAGDCRVLVEVPDP